MNKLFILFLLFAYVVGTFGAIGYLCYYGEYHIVIGVVATAYLAFFKAREYVDGIRNDKYLK